MLHAHRSESAEGLVVALAETLASRPPDDPFAPEIISVPTRGMERWLAQRLSSMLGTANEIDGARDGVCANVDFPSPVRLVAGILAVACGQDPDADPWTPERSSWPLLEVVERDLGEAPFTLLAAHLLRSSAHDDSPRGRRLSSIRRLASLFDRYSLHRPDMVCAWAAGQDTDDAGTPLERDFAWQAELWRRLRHQIGTPSPAERLSDACRRLEAGVLTPQLPERICLFGITRLPAGYLRVLAAVAAGGRDMHLFMLHPSPQLWQRVAKTLALSGPVRRRRADPTAEAAENRLLASWGRDAREMQLVIDRPDGVEHHHHPVGPAHRDTLLARLQSAIGTDTQPPGEPATGMADLRPMLAEDDRSVQVHACHGRARQVEVLRDAVLHLLAADPTLEPRDVIVMCPDVETFAPLVQATFGAGLPIGAPEGASGRPGRAEWAPSTVPRAGDLRVRLADRSPRQTNAVLGAVAELLDLASTRATATQLLGFAEREPVRHRFGWDDDDLVHLHRWVSASGIRWGLDQAARLPYRLEPFAGGTWQAGLDRVLLGVALDEQRRETVAGILPLDDVDSASIELAGRFAQFVTRLTRVVHGFLRPKPVVAWAQELATAADALTSVPDSSGWQRIELQRLLDDLCDEAATSRAAGEVAVTLAEMRGLLSDRLAGRPTRANFRTGSLTVCTLMPMRSVPHRIVCLLGLDDDLFPRRSPRDGDDLTLRDPHVGERDGRSEDRQLLLDALLAAGEHLVITYSGADERTNAARPPAVPVGELLDAIDDTVRLGSPAGRAAAPARTRVLVRHPLQPYHADNFTPGRLGCPRSWSFDPVMRRGADALRARRREDQPFLPAPLEPLRERVVPLEDLVSFLQHPVRAFLRRRLNVSLHRPDDELEDALRVQLGPLDRSRVGQRMLDARLQGVSIRAACLAEIGRGELPPGELGHPVIREIASTVEAIASATVLVTAQSGPATWLSVDVRVSLDAQRSLRGTVPDVRATTILASHFSRVSARQRLAAWVNLLALSVTQPETEYEAVTIGRDPEDGESAAVFRMRAPGRDPASRAALARAELERLVGLFDRGMCEPLPLPVATGAAYAAAALSGQDQYQAAGEQWRGRDQRSGAPRGEYAEREHVLVLGGELELSELLALAPAPWERGAGWAAEEESRLGRLALRIWTPLLSQEQIR